MGNFNSISPPSTGSSSRTPTNEPYVYQLPSFDESQEQINKLVHNLLKELRQEIARYRDKPHWFVSLINSDPKDRTRIFNNIHQIAQQILFLLPHASTALAGETEIVLKDWGDTTLLSKFEAHLQHPSAAHLLEKLKDHLQERKVNSDINTLYQQLLALAPHMTDAEFLETERLSAHTHSSYREKLTRIKELRPTHQALDQENCPSTQLSDFLESLQTLQTQVKSKANLPWEAYTLGTAASNQLQEKLILKQLFSRLLKLADEANPNEDWNTILMDLDKESIVQAPLPPLSQTLSSQWTPDNVKKSYQLISKQQSKIFGLSDEKKFTLEAIHPTFSRLLNQMQTGQVDFNPDEKELILEVLLEAEKQAQLTQHLKKQTQGVEEIPAIHNEIKSLINQAKKALKLLPEQTGNLAAIENAFNILNELNLPAVNTNPHWSELMEQANFTLKKIGEGSFGRAYLAQRGQERYIVKEFLFNTKEEITPPTLREWLAAERGERTARLKHPHLIMTIGAFLGQTHVQAIVMPYIENSLSLFDILTDKQLPPEKIQSFFKQLLQGVKALHDAGFIHKDIKLENILIAQNEKGEFEKLYLIDAGLQEKLTNIKTKSTLGCGSPLYAAPEVWKEPHDYSADIYSLGVTLLAMYTGKVANNPRTTLNEISNAPLKKLISDMLEVDPLKRPSIDLVIQRYGTLFPTQT